MAGVAILTPVRDGREHDLRNYLRRLDAPFRGLKTHFARLVVIDIGAPHLFFSSKFDGDEHDYLPRFARFSDAVAIWRHCQRPDPCTAESLAEYLLDRRNRAEADYVIDMVPTATVAGINAALRLRAEVSALAGRSGGLDALALAHEFRQLESIRALTGR
jgi:hypothetical protein